MTTTAEIYPIDLPEEIREALVDRDETLRSFASAVLACDFRGDAYQRTAELLLPWSAANLKPEECGEVLMRCVTLAMMVMPATKEEYDALQALLELRGNGVMWGSGAN